MTIRNERKIQILNILLYATRPYTGEEIAESCLILLNCAYNRLLSYLKQGLVKREKENGVFVYTITKKGIKRLEYLSGSEKIKPQIELVGLSIKKETIREAIKREASNLNI